MVNSRLKKLLCIIASIPVLMTREDDMIFHFQASKSDSQLIPGLCPYTDF